MEKTQMVKSQKTLIPVSLWTGHTYDIWLEGGGDIM